MGAVRGEGKDGGKVLNARRRGRRMLQRRGDVDMCTVREGKENAPIQTITPAVAHNFILVRIRIINKLCQGEP